MRLSTEDLIQAKEATRTLLERLGLAAYLFEVEPREKLWQVRVDCAVDGGWQSITLDVDLKQLLMCRNDPGVHEQILAQWRKQLAACRSE